MIERLKELRKVLGLTQTEFGEKLGRKKITVTFWESGKSAIPTSMIYQICSTFGVSYDWLTEGKGEMFVESAESLVEDVMRDNPQFGDIERSIVRNWLRIPHDERLRILDTISKVFDIRSDDDT